VNAATIFVIGECMIELQRLGGGAAMPDSAQTGQASLAYRFGGDTLNAAVYMARLADPQRFRIAYVSALGTDGLSDEMCAAWQEEGILTSCVQRLADKLPGMYLIENDASGERRFHYWRNDSAARYWLQRPGAADVLAQLAKAPWIYLSGISLAILAPADRARLLAALAECRAAGGRIVFDNNYRPRLWKDSAEAAASYREVLALTEIALLTLDDETLLYGPASAAEVLERTRTLGVPEVVLKRGAESCLVQTAQGLVEVAGEPVAEVVDTTAAGDSFGAAYVAARLAGQSPEAAARAGHRLAGVVIGQRGAIIPRSLMPA
jgi:2-dehydro-3-deoxygluconokinase